MMISFSARLARWDVRSILKRNVRFVEIPIKRLRFPGRARPPLRAVRRRCCEGAHLDSLFEGAHLDIFSSTTQVQRSFEMAHGTRKRIVQAILMKSLSTLPMPHQATSRTCIAIHGDRGVKQRLMPLCLSVGSAKDATRRKCVERPSVLS